MAVLGKAPRKANANGRRQGSLSKAAMASCHTLGNSEHISKKGTRVMQCWETTKYEAQLAEPTENLEERAQ